MLQEPTVIAAVVAAVFKITQQEHIKIQKELVFIFS